MQLRQGTTSGFPPAAARVQDVLPPLLLRGQRWQCLTCHPLTCGASGSGLEKHSAAEKETPSFASE